MVKPIRLGLAGVTAEMAKGWQQTHCLMEVLLGQAWGVCSEPANFPVSWTVQPLHFQRLPGVSSKPPLLRAYNSVTSPVQHIYKLKSHMYYTPPIWGYSSTALCCNDFSVFATARCQSESYLSWRMEKPYPTVIGFFLKKHTTQQWGTPDMNHTCSCIEYLGHLVNVNMKTSLSDAASWCGREEAEGGGGGRHITHSRSTYCYHSLKSSFFTHEWWHVSQNA